MVSTFSGDYRIMRVVMDSKNPIDTLHKIRSGQYSIITFLDMLELMDVRDTILEDEEIIRKMSVQQ